MATWTLYNKHKQYQYDGTAPIDWNSDTIKVALLTSGYTPDIDTHDYFDDVSANELASGNGYTAGGETLTNPTVTLDTTNDLVKLDADDVSWNFTDSVSFKYAVLYKDTGDPATSPLIAYVDLGDTTISGTFTLQFDADGLINVS